MSQGLQLSHGPEMSGYFHIYKVLTQVTVRFVGSGFLSYSYDLWDFHFSHHPPTLSPPCSYTYTWECRGHPSAYPHCSWPIARGSEPWATLKWYLFLFSYCPKMLTRSLCPTQEVWGSVLKLFPSWYCACIFAFSYLYPFEYCESPLCIHYRLQKHWKRQSFTVAIY